MNQEAADELVCLQRHGSDAIVFFAVSPLECDPAVLKCHQAVVGNGDAVRIAAEVIEDLNGAPKGRFGVDDPFMFAVSVQELAKGF